MIGTTIEHYRITARLGGGGMGDVYRAIDLELDREVAIKCVRADLTDIEDVTRRFRAEARTLARLSHRNIATVFRFFAKDDQLFLVMEYIAGNHFGTMLQAGALHHTQALQLLRQALDGLGYAHRQKVVHRDIKPGNLMVDASGTVKVLDFGIAHLLDTTRMTRTGSVIGTPAYMAPEQALGKAVDARTDLYSLGIVLYEMLTGDLPFQANSDFELMRAHVEAQPRALSDLSPEVPRTVQQAIHRVLAKDSAERFQTAEEFADALRLPDEDATVISAPAARAQHQDVPASVAAQALATTLIRQAANPRTRAVAAGIAIGLGLTGAFWLLSGNQPVAPAEAAVTAGPGSGTAPAAQTETDSGSAAQPEAEPTPAVPAAAAEPSRVMTAEAASAQPRPAPERATTTRSAAASTAALPRTATAPASTAARPSPQTAPPPPSIRVRKISVHEQQGTGRFSRAAGYNGSFSLSVPSGRSSELRVEEFLEVSRDGSRVLRELVTAESRQPGIFSSKQRVPALKELPPGPYDVRLVFVTGGVTMGHHDWQLEVVD